MKSTLSAVLLSLMATTATACPGFSVGQTSCSSGVLTRSSLSASCGDDNDVIYVSGTVTAGSDFDDGSKVTLLPCVRGTGGKVCFDQYKQDAGDLCSLISSSDGSACGSAGTYTVDLEFDIPEEAQRLSSMFSMFEIKVLIDDEEACQQQADSTNAAFLMVGVGSIVGASALYFIRRRKKPLLVLDDEEQVDFDGSPRAQFVEMKGYDVGRMA